MAFTDCQTALKVRSWEFDETNFLVANEITAEDMMGFISQINVGIGAQRQAQVKQTKIILGYTLGGIVFMAAFATAIGLLVAPWFSIFFIVIYFGGLYFIQKRSTRISAELEKEMFFNLAVCLQNLNREVLEKNFKLKAKIGHMAQWIEFHSLRRPSSTGDEEEPRSEKDDLLSS